MSYILEALKKAEAERQQGAVPTLHAPAAVLPADIGMPAGRRQYIVAGGLMLAILLGALIWLRPWQGASEPSPAPVPPAPERTTAPQPEATVVAVAPAPVAPTPTPALTHSRSKPRTLAHERAPKAIARQAAESGQAGATPAAPASAAVPVAPVASASSTATIPAPIASRELPGVSIGGYIYSETPAERQLLVNKRLMHEGEEVMPGLRLEKMLPKAAIFNYRGQRYQVAY